MKQRLNFLFSLGLELYSISQAPLQLGGPRNYVLINGTSVEMVGATPD